MCDGYFWVRDQPGKGLQPAELDVLGALEWIPPDGR
jgi:hypothetical protein